MRSTFALFYVAMLAELGWSRGTTALGYSLSWLGFVVFAPAAGWLSDRWGARATVTLGGVVLGAALALTARVTSPASYYASFGLIGAAGIAAMIIPATTIVSRWFVRGRGTAMGVLSAANAGSAIVFYPINAWLIAAFGWRVALGAFGGAVALVTVAVATLYREPPEASIVPLGARGERVTGDARAAAADARGEAWTLRRALRSGRLWAAFAMMVLGTIGFQIMATHQVAHAIDRGFAQATVVWIFAFGAAFTMAGNLFGGWLSDQLGRGWVFALGSLIAILGIAALAAVRGPHDVALLFLYMVSGIGFGMRIAQLSAIPADVFAGPALGAIFGVVQAGGGIGGFIGPYLGGWLFDVTGSYRLAFTAATVAFVGAAVAAWWAARPVAHVPARPGAMLAP